MRRIPEGGTTGGFGWLDDRLLSERWLARLGPEATAVLVLLVLAADRYGVSYYRRETMVGLLGMSRESVDRGLSRLQRLGLVAHRAWGPGQADGVWQVLPVKHAGRHSANTDSEATSIGEIIAPLRSDLAKSPPPDFRAL